VPEQNSIKPSTALILVISCAMLALGQVAVKSVSDQISPLYHAAFRSAGATFVVIAWMMYRRIKLYESDDTLNAGLLAGLFFSLEFIFLFPGITLAGAARGTLLIYSTPFFVALGAHFLIENDKLNRNKIIGLLAAFAGVFFVMMDRLSLGNTATALQGNPLLTSIKNYGFSPGLVGDVFCLLAAFFWASTTLVVKATKLKSIQPERTLLYQLAVSIPLLFLGALTMNEQGITRHSPQLYGVLAFGIFIVASLLFVIWFNLMRTYKASTIHAFTLLTPIFAVVFSGLFLNEPITSKLLAAVACVCVGIYMVNKAE
jgi:drug/metabolite transporter (DMT)-like permease